MTFEQTIIDETIERLLQGKDYREAVVAQINKRFLDFTMSFFQKIVKAKSQSKQIDLSWYRDNFINAEDLDIEDICAYAGTNKKTVTNICGTARKDVVLDFSNQNFENLCSLINEYEKDSNNSSDVTMNISYNGLPVTLSLAESLIVINAIATKKIQLRGGAWSSIGKKVEKPLLDKLCDMAGVPLDHRKNTPFVKDKNKNFDREVDYFLYGNNKQEYRIEVKLMGKGNSESADATIARDSDIFVADTLSEQNCEQLKDRGIEYLILKGNTDPLTKFKTILDTLDIPYAK